MSPTDGLPVAYVEDNNALHFNSMVVEICKLKPSLRYAGSMDENINFPIVAPSCWAADNVNEWRRNPYECRWSEHEEPYIL